MQEYNFFFFFSSRRRHTRWNCDWSSDVCSSDLNLVEQSVGLPVQLIPPLAHKFVELRLEPAERLLLHAINPRRELLQPFRRLIHPCQRLFQLPGLLAQRTQHGRTLRRALLLQFFPQLLRLFPQRRRCQLLGRTHFLRYLLAQRILRLFESRAHLLLNLIQHRAQRILLRASCFFSLLLRRLQSRRSLGFHLLRMGPQLRRRFFRLRAHRLQCFLGARQLLFVLIPLKSALPRQVRHQFMRKLFQLWRQPSRQFTLQRFRSRRLRCPSSSLGLFLDSSDSMCRFFRYLFAESRVFPLPLFHGLLAFGCHSMRGRLYRCRMNLLLRLREQSRHLPRQLQRRIRRARRGREHSQIIRRRHSRFRFHNRQRRFARRRHSDARRQIQRRSRIRQKLIFFRKRKPVVGRKRNPPRIPRCLQLQRHLKQLPHRPRPLDPRHLPAHAPRRMPLLRVRNLQVHPHIFQHVMFRLVPAPVAIDDQSRSPLRKRTPQRVHTRHHQWHGLHDTRAASLPQFFACVCRAFCRHFACFVCQVGAAGFVLHGRRTTLLARLITEYLWLLRLGCILLAVRTGHGIPDFLRDPYWPNQQVNRSLEKCGLVALDPVAQE